MMKTSTVRAQSIVGTSPGRSAIDFYPTPAEATNALLDNVNFNAQIWECACGDGAISKVLEKRGHKTLSTDLYDYGFGTSGINFLHASNATLPYDIITNPPFNLAERFIDHAIYELDCQRVALLLKLAFLEGQKRSRQLESTPLEKVLVFRKRLTMTRGGEAQKSSGMIAFAWFIWDKDYTGSATIGWI
jgi:hypothetical protein